MKKGRTTKLVGSKRPDIEHPQDESNLHVRRIPHPLFAPAPSIVENIFFSRVGHTFKQAPTVPGAPKQFLVQDFLLDQTGASGADGKMSALKQFDLTTTTSYRFNVF